MDGEKLRDGIFALRTRRFGSVTECMIKRLLTYSKARSLFHDLYDDQRKHRIEVKFSVVQKKAETTVTEETVLRCIEESVAENRMVAFPAWKQHKFDCNIQQVKRAEFDSPLLWAVLFRLHQDFPHRKQGHKREPARRPDLLL